MMTPRRRLLAYAKQTTRAAFTPAQRRRMIKQANRAGHLATKQGWTNQDLTEAVGMRLAAKAGPEHLQDMVNLILSTDPTPDLVTS